MQANLTINQKQPILQRNEPGPCTIFVSAIDNWTSSGTTPPDIPYDVHIEVVQKLGAINHVDEFALPAVGYMGHYSADELVVYAHYTDEGGAAVPWPNYLVSAGLIQGWAERRPKRKSYLVEYNQLFPVNYSSAGITRKIPSFVQEIRVEARGVEGYITLLHPVFLHAAWFYEFEATKAWTPIPPNAHWWSATYDGVRYQTDSSYTIEFR